MAKLMEQAAADGGDFAEDENSEEVRAMRRKAMTESELAKLMGTPYPPTKK